MQVKEQAGFRGEYQIEIIDTVTGAREIHKLTTSISNILLSATATRRRQPHKQSS